LAYCTSPEWQILMVVEQLVEWQGKPNHSDKTCLSAALYTTNPTFEPGSISGRRCGEPGTNRLSYCTACKTVKSTRQANVSISPQGLTNLIYMWVRFPPVTHVSSVKTWLVTNQATVFRFSGPASRPALYPPIFLSSSCTLHWLMCGYRCAVAKPDVLRVTASRVPNCPRMLLYVHHIDRVPYTSSSC
jgi:hypothetical protein